MDRLKLMDKIKKLKLKRDALILAHNYQADDIQAIADIVGDSLKLSRVARDTKQHKTIVFCGVTFMAETAKILSPDKTILLPVKDAICPMARMATAEQILKYRKKYPDTTVVCYVNSTTEVKAVSDICITSANALTIIAKIQNQPILLVPDENLGYYIKERIPHKVIDLWPGYCITHKRVKKEDVVKAKALHRDAQVLVHPECTKDVLEEAHFIGSTSQIIGYVKESTYSKFIIGTEMGVLHQLQKEHSDKTFYLLSQGLICSNMKKIRLKDVYDSLLYNQYPIELDANLQQKALCCMEKMFLLNT